MRKVKIYSIVTLEGYVCDRSGGFDWIVEHDLPASPGYGMTDFLRNIGLVVMSRSFYSVMADCELSHHFAKLPCLVSKKSKEGTVHGMREVEYVDSDDGFGAIVERVRQLKISVGDDIWIAGDVKLIGALFDAGLIDEIHLTEAPVSIGDGIRLLPRSFNKNDWRITTIVNDSRGYTRLVYRSSALVERNKIN